MKVESADEFRVRELKEHIAAAQWLAEKLGGHLAVSVHVDATQRPLNTVFASVELGKSMECVHSFGSFNSHSRSGSFAHGVQFIVTERTEPKSTDDMRDLGTY